MYRNRSAKFRTESLILWTITSSVFFILVVTPLLQDGMFVDGVVSSSVARNLAIGHGSFWSPVYLGDISGGPVFNDQLPLTFGIQSFFFRVFGDHLFVERMYSFLTCILSAFFIIRLWKLIYRSETGISGRAWLPLLLWIITPIVAWSFHNNMLENTVAVFDIAAIYFLFRGLETGRKILLQITVAGVLTTAAFLSKGPVGLFPLGAIVIYQICFRKFTGRKTFYYSLILWMVPTFISVLLFYVNGEAFHFVRQYFDQQVLRSIEGHRESVQSRFFILIRLCTELIPIAILLITIRCISIYKKMKAEQVPRRLRTSTFFFVIALSGALPICISLKQSGYYLVPSLAFFAMASGILIAGDIQALIKKLNLNSKSPSSAVVLLISLLAVTIFVGIGILEKPGRYSAGLQDVYSIGKMIPANSVVSICAEQGDDWGFFSYLMRYDLITVDSKVPHDYLILKKNNCRELISNFSKIEAHTILYEVYKRKSDSVIFNSQGK